LIFLIMGHRVSIMRKDTESGRKIDVRCVGVK
jgi:hypothetical protein